MVEAEHTPNPDTLKFLPGKKVSEAGSVEFSKKDSNVSIKLASDILSLKGTLMVFFGEDFITVKKEKNQTWDSLKHSVISHINDFYSKGHSIVIEKNYKTLNEKEESNEIVNKIKEILNNKVRPAVAKDGGDIKFKSFNNGVVKVELQGSCSGCPSSVMTLKQGVQNLLCHYIPEVKKVDAV